MERQSGHACLRPACSRCSVTWGFRRKRLSCGSCRPRGRRSPTNRAASLCARPRRGRAGPYQHQGQHDIVDASQFTSALLSGPFDGSAAAWKDAEREKALLFSQPYLENRLMLVARRGGDVSAATVADLKGKRVAIVEGYAYGEAIDQSGAAVVRSRSEEDSLKLLLDSKVDYTLMDELVVQYILSNYADEARTRLQIGSTPLVKRQLHLAVRRSVPDAESIINRFNAQLRGMIADRTYHRLLHLEWIEADVDGDGRVEFVPKSDRPGAAEPKQAYSLFSTEPSAHTDAQGPRALSSRRQYLRRLDDRAGQVQGRRSEAAGSEQIDRLHLPVCLVVGSEPRLASQCSAAAIARRCSGAPCARRTSESCRWPSLAVPPSG